MVKIGSLKSQEKIVVMVFLLLLVLGIGVLCKSCAAQSSNMRVITGETIITFAQ